MQINEQALNAYNSLPRDLKGKAARNYGTATWYFKALISNVATPKDQLVKALDAIACASKENKDHITKIDKSIQRTVKLALKNIQLNEVA